MQASDQPYCFATSRDIGGAELHLRLAEHFSIPYLSVAVIYSSHLLASLDPELMLLCHACPKRGDFVCWYGLERFDREISRSEFVEFLTALVRSYSMSAFWFDRPDVGYRGLVFDSSGQRPGVIELPEETGTEFVPEEYVLSKWSEDEDNQAS